MARKVLFIDRDGTLVKEPDDFQLDNFSKLEFCPGVFKYLGKIASEMEFDLVIITNQDGLGSASFPKSDFWPVQDFIIKSLSNEGIVFSEVCIDSTFANENAPTRKPRTGLLSKYLNNPNYDLANSFVIGDRITDVELAKNLNCSAIFLNSTNTFGTDENSFSLDQLQDHIALRSNHWSEIYGFLTLKSRTASIRRKTNETDVAIELNLDGTGKSSISTGLAFFDHMLEQLSRHGNFDLQITVAGDLEVDEHHTIEDTAIALGNAFSDALGNKLGIERYGFCLPMDDCLAQVAIDFGGRNWVVWDAPFLREKIGDMPTEMFFHFFKSFSDGAKANLNIKAEGNNEHHKIEAIFKSFAKAIKFAVKRDHEKMILPSTKGML